MENDKTRDDIPKEVQEGMDKFIKALAEMTLEEARKARRRAILTIFSILIGVMLIGVIVGWLIFK